MHLCEQSANVARVKRISAIFRSRIPHIDMRRVLTFVLAFAFAAQAQLAAAHFHIGVDAKEQALFGLADSKAPAKNKAPLGDRDCPISQLVAASHSYVAGCSTPTVLPAPVAERVAVERTQPRAVALIALNWQSRAPPV
jgi:hypothetical protein